MKKIWLASPFILSMLSFALFAEEAQMSNSIELAKSTLFARQQKSSADKACKTCCAPPMNYRLPAEFNGFNTFAEALVWQVQEQASFFAATPNEHSVLDVTANNSQVHGDLQSASFDWNGGLRLGLGYTFVQDAWQVLGQYTWYSTSGENSFSTPAGSATEFLMSTFTTVGFGPLEASSSAHFTYQMADLLLARRFLVKDRVQLNFSLGATGGYIKEDFSITYNNIGLNDHVSNDWAFGGGGFRTGIDANWHILQGFGVFGKMSFAAILGQYGNHNRITSDAPATATFSTLAPPRLRYTNYTGILLLPTTQIVLGFDWCRSFVNCWVSGVRVAVAGEFNYLSNLQQTFKTMAGPTIPQYPGKSMTRDVGGVFMYGANVRLGADF